MNRNLSRFLSMALLSAALVLAAVPAAFGCGGPADPPPWIKMTAIPTTENLNAVTAASKRSVWFAGDNGTILNWTGKAFKSYKVELPDNVRLRDIHMFSASDGWAVGYNTANYYGRIYRWDGRAWKLATSEGIKGTKFTCVAFLSPQDGLAVGEEGHLYRWDGRTWADKTSTILFGSQVNSGRLSLVTDVEADLDKRVYVLACHYKTKKSPDRTDSVYVRLDLKTNPAGAFYNTPVLDSVTLNSFSRLFAVPEGKFHYLADKTVYTFSHGISTWDKAGIRQFAFNLNQGILHGLWLFGKDDGWFVGDYGAVLRLQPGPRSQTYTPVSERLNDIWMLDTDYGFIAGDKGTILMRNTPAGVVLDLDADKLEYDSGEQVVLGVYRVSQAATAAVSLEGSSWEIKRETTTNETTSLTTVFSSSRSPQTRADEQRLDAGEILTLLWDQKDSQSRQVRPGAYRAYFRVGGLAPSVRFTIREPTGPIISSDQPDQHGGLVLDLPASYPSGDVTFKLTNRDSRSVSLSGATYSVAIKRSDGWHGFYASGERSAFHPETIAAGQSYEWTWRRQDTSGRQQAAAGHYRLTVNMPGHTPDQLTKEFDIIGQ